MSGLRRAIRLSCSVWMVLALAVGACDGGSSLAVTEGPQPPVDSLAPPIDTGAPPPPDSGAPPPAPPTPPPPPADPPVHTGIPFGPNVLTKHESSQSLLPPASLSPTFNALLTAAHKPILLAKLEEARRTDGRVLLSFAGTPAEFADSNGFNLAKWKQGVDRFRDLDFSSYIADGTLMGHFILDEPSDPSNWNGHVVSLADIDEMARYSKEIWPGLPAIIRGWPDFLKGYDYQYLDAAWASYHSRFGSMDDFITNNVRDAKASGLALIVGLNIVAGGGDDGIPGYHFDKKAMNASQVRTWGGALLAEPYICAFIMWRYNADYFARPDIQEVMVDLSGKAQSFPKKECRRS